MDDGSWSPDPTLRNSVKRGGHIPPPRRGSSFGRMSLPHDVPFAGACTTSKRHLVANTATAAAFQSMRLSAISGHPGSSGIILDRNALSGPLGHSGSAPRASRRRCGYVKASEVVPRSFHLAATRSRRASRVLSSRQEFQRVPSFSIGGTSARLPQHRCKVLGTWREATERRRSAVGDLSSSGRYPGNLPHPADTRSPKPRSTILRRQE